MNPKPSAYAAALKRISVREYSEKEITDYLSRKGYESAEIQDALKRLKEQSFIDEARYARAATRSYSLRQRGPAFIRMKLRSKGVQLSKTEADTLFRDNSPEDEADMILHYLERRVTEIPKAYEARQKLFNKLQQGLLRRGFTASLTLKILKDFFKGWTPPAEEST